MVSRENKTQKRAAVAKKNMFLNKSELMIFFLENQEYFKEFFWEINDFFLENQEYFKEKIWKSLSVLPHTPPGVGGWSGILKFLGDGFNFFF